MVTRLRELLNHAGCSKDWDLHNPASYSVGFSYWFRRPLRTLRVKDAGGHWQARSPALAAGLAGHVWAAKEWLTYPAKGS